jgi:hypothetical protein
LNTTHTTTTTSREDCLQRFIELAPSIILSKTTTSSVIAKTNEDQNALLHQTDVARYEECLLSEQKECEGIDKTRQEIYRQQVELWGVYKYGLEQIASLNDLGDAPDAILPGNFC